MEREPPYTDGKIEVTPAAGPLGAEIRGVDLSADIDAPTLEAIERAWARHLVLEWHDQPLTVAQHIAFGRRLGQLEDMSHVDQPETGLPPEVLVIVNDPALNDAAAPPAGYLKGFQNKHVQWHSDNSYREVPPKGSLFAVKESPPEGGVTIFSNMYAAYETLPTEMKRKVAGRELIHDPSLNSANVLREGVTPPTDVSKGRGPRHPLVRVHPVTGRPALYLGRRPYAYICGYGVDESEALLDALWAHATADRFVWQRAVNKPGDLLLWDNRCTMHARTAFASASPRLAHRVQIAGEPVIAA